MPKLLLCGKFLCIAPHAWGAKKAPIRRCGMWELDYDGLEILQNSNATISVCSTFAGRPFISEGETLSNAINNHTDNLHYCANQIDRKLT